MSTLPSAVTLVDVGPRDGLQNEKQAVDSGVKIELVQRLQAAGMKEIEVTSFVSPKWVPQMGDNAAVMAGIVRQPGVRYSVLVPNMKGLDAALSAPREQWPDEVVVFAAANTSPEPFSNIALSLLGDGLVPFVLWLSWAHPVLLFVTLGVALLVMLATIWVLGRFLRRAASAVALRYRRPMPPAAHSEVTR